MISRRDNLLVRPWQQRRYDNHRKKVQSARPAIDNKPPLPRQHVALKLKKKQKESERCQEIEKNNFSLLKRLSYVMRTSRVDNLWTTPQPNFLHRVSMYDLKFPQLEELCIEEQTFPQQSGNRKSKCVACTPQAAPEPKIPEERIPWEPEKPRMSKFRSKSVPVRKPAKVVEEPRPATTSKIQPKVQEKRKIERNFNPKEPLSIILSRGCLKLSVNFPSDTLVKLHEKNHERTLVQDICHCKNVTGLSVQKCV